MLSLPLFLHLLGKHWEDAVVAALEGGGLHRSFFCSSYHAYQPFRHGRKEELFSPWAYSASCKHDALHSLSTAPRAWTSHLSSQNLSTLSLPTSI